jgi:hypothetical protein
MEGWTAEYHAAGIRPRGGAQNLSWVPKVSAFVWEMTIDCKAYPISLFN